MGREAELVRVGSGGTRLWVLGVFSALSLLQSVSWNIFSPVQSTVRSVYGWSDGDIGWLANTANIAMLVSLPVSIVAAEAHGARAPTIGCAVTMCACTLLRLVPAAAELLGDPLPARSSFWINLVSMVFNGLAAAWLNFAGPVLSELWFSASERATATAVITVAPYVGTALGFVLGPLLIPGGQAGKRALEATFLAEAACAVVVLLAVMVRFPPRPAAAPSESAARRGSLVVGGPGADPGLADAEVRPLLPSAGEGAESGQPQQRGEASPVSLWGALFACGDREVRSLWLITVAFSVPLGVFSGWGAVLTINLCQVSSMSELAAGWVGCLMTLLGSVAGIVVAALNDRFAGRLKTCIVLCQVLSTVCFTAFGLRVLEYWVPSNAATDAVVLYGLPVAGGFFLNAPLPLFYELAVEETYPRIPAGIASGILTVGITLVQILFLLYMAIVPAAGNSTDAGLSHAAFGPGELGGGGPNGTGPSSSTSGWMNWSMMLSIPLFTLPLLLLRVRYGRQQLDNPGLRVAWLDRAGWC